LLRTCAHTTRYQSPPFRDCRYAVSTPAGQTHRRTLRAGEMVMRGSQ
jgi:hypothetical protein